MSVTQQEISCHDIPSLLHDANCVHFDWDETGQSIHLEFEALRCDSNGREIKRPVTVCLNQVVQLAAYVRPPRMIPGLAAHLKPGELLKKKQLRNWKNPGGGISINSCREEIEFSHALKSKWILGDSHHSAPYTVCFRSSSGDLWMACHSITTLDSGHELSMKQWADQYSNWWKAWKQHWDDSKSNKESESSAAKFDAAIPLAEEVEDTTKEEATNRESIELPHPFPAEVFPNRLQGPKELLRPIGDYLEGLHQRDWIRVAEAFPDLDIPKVQVAAKFAKRNAQGPWIFARQIDHCWHENGLALVSVRGVEYESETAEAPACAKETVISFEMRCYQDRWIIWNYSQGWVGPGSAPALEARQPWHDEWNLNSHLPRVVRRGGGPLNIDEGEILTTAQSILVLAGLIVLSLALVWGCFWLKSKVGRIEQPKENRKPTVKQVDVSETQTVRPKLNAGPVANTK